MTNNLYDLNFEELENMILALNEPSFRATQIWQGLYKKLWGDFEEFTNLPHSLRELLSQKYTIGVLSVERELLSQDRNTKKILYSLEDGAAIETVLMAYNDRDTVCISSQVGCAMGCEFCATGNMGFIRNLEPGEIVEQVVKAGIDLSAEEKSLSNVVFMGMGEPFHNYQAVMKAIQTLNDHRGFGMGMRRFTISTVGFIPGIKKFIKERSQVNLAISLHAADDKLRSTIVPINNKYPLPELMAACNEYLQVTKRRITVEWALIEGVNDSIDQANKLAKLLAGKLYHVNLIQLNPVEHYPGKPAEDEKARKFKEVITETGIPCTIRLRRGIDIQAGCGQLASKSN